MFANKLLLTLSSLCLAVLVAYAPGAQAACSCLCMDSPDGSGAAPTWECSADTFILEPEPASCQQMQCQPLDTPVVDTTPTVEPTPPADTTTAGSEEPAAEDDVMSCQYRSLYRPDLGKYKKVKVCRLTSEQRQKMREKASEFAENHPEAAQRYADHMARLKAKHEARSKHEHKSGKYGKYGKHTGD